MLVSPRFLRVRPRVLVLAGVVFCVVLWSLLSGTKSRPRLLNQESIRLRYPLAWEHIQQNNKSSSGGEQFFSSHSPLPMDSLRRILHGREIC